MASPTTAPQPSATALPTTPNKSQSITNNSGTDIVVGTPITADETENTTPIVSINKDFEILKTASGGTVIKDGSTDTVTLDRSHLDATTNQPIYSKGYDLLISSSNWLTPIANIGVALNPITKVFRPQTVTADSKTAMDQAAAFYQTIAAYPTSKLATDYINAMNGVSDDADSKADGSDGSATNVNDSIESGVAAFFASTKNYQKVTLANIVAMEAYYNMFPFAWAAYADTTTYYLYSSDGNTASFQGALSLTKSGDVDITKANGGYTCSFAPAVTPSDTSKTDVNTAAAKTLTFSDGVFMDDVNSDTPQIALKGAFSLKRTFTKDPNDTKIIVIISGTINGATCLGFDQTQATKPDDSTQDWLDSLFHPTTAAGIFNSVMQILGALMMLHFVVTTLWGIGKWIRNKVGGGDNTVKPDELKAQKESFSSDTKAKIDSIYEKLNGNKGAKTPDTAEAAQAKAAETQSTLSDQVSSGQMETSVNNMSNNLEQLEELTATNSTLNTQVETAADNLGTAWDSFTNNADLKSAVTELQAQVKTLQTQVEDLNTKVQDQVSQDQRAEYDENVENMNEVKATIENQDKTKQDEAEEEETDDISTDILDDPL